MRRDDVGALADNSRAFEVRLPIVIGAEEVAEREGLDRARLTGLVHRQHIALVAHHHEVVRAEGKAGRGVAESRVGLHGIRRPSGPGPPSRRGPARAKHQA
ncbi:hypothetical protein D3C85_1687810 [compost metagenome]